MPLKKQLEVFWMTLMRTLAMMMGMLLWPLVKQQIAISILDTVDDMKSDGDSRDDP